MSDSDWRKRFAFGRGLIALALLAMCHGVATAQPHDGPSGAAQRQNAERQRSDVEPPLPSLESKAKYRADYERACNHPEDPQEADLCQQWRTANAAEESAAIAERQFWATVVEGLLLFVSVIFTAIAARAAAKAALAAQGSVDIAKRAVSVAERDLRESNRARPKLFIYEVHIAQDGAVRIGVYFRNEGERIGTVESAIADTLFAGDHYAPPPPRRVETDKTHNTSVFIVQQISLRPDPEEESVPSYYNRRERLTEMQIAEIRQKKAFFFFYGVVRYRDHMHNERDRGFCFRLGLGQPHDWERLGNSYDFDEPVQKESE